MEKYGKLGVNVGPVGRWIRLLFGLLLILYVGTDFYPASHSHSIGTYFLILASFISILVLFTLAHLFLGEWLSKKHAIWGTFIFVVPAMFLLIAPEFNPSMQLGSWLNFPQLNHPFGLSLLLYIGISFLFQWQAKYGGCEVVSIPNFLFKKNYGSYCVPLLPLDFIEKKIVDMTSGSKPSET